MKYNFFINQRLCYTFYLLIIVCCFYSAVVSQQKTASKNNFIVRVALDIKPSNESHSWDIRSSTILTIRHVHNNQVVATENAQHVTVKNHRCALHCNNKRIKAKMLQISSLDDHIIFNNRTYQGSLLIVVEQQFVYSINKIPLEDYVYSSLGTECWPGWPLQVTKALAIAIRTYAIAKVTESRATKTLYHIKNTNIHQTYKGIHSHERVRKAVEETAGIIITHNNKPIVAMFDGCCGGIIPAHMKEVDFDQAPYLKRKYACKYCKHYKLFNWRGDYELQELTKIFKQSGIIRSPVKYLEIGHKDKAGVVHEVIIYDNRKNKYIVTGKKMYSLFDTIKSFVFDITHNGSKVSIIGKGYGHHLGLCQWGAYEMDKQGWQYQDILKFYYKDIKLMKLDVTPKL